MTPVVRLLLLLNVGLFALQSLLGVDLVSLWGLWPLQTPGRLPDFHVWQLLTYGFLHANLTHLFLNMFALYMFGREVERLWGSQRFAEYYLVCVVGAAVVQQLVTGAGYIPTVGASGGVFGLLLAFGLMFPRQIVVLLIPPIPMQARWLVLIYGALELWLGVTSSGSAIAHFAHLGGMLFGYLMIQYWRGRLPIKPRMILRR